MRFVFFGLNAAELQGGSVVELLINLEADFEIDDEDGVIYAERAFPVVELARDLVAWIASACAKREDFEFESLSFEEKGVVRIVQSPEGWLVGSVFEPELWSRPIGCNELSQAVLSFAANLRRDLVRLEVGAWLIPDPLIGDT